MIGRALDSMLGWPPWALVALGVVLTIVVCVAAAFFLAWLIARPETMRERNARRLRASIRRAALLRAGYVERIELERQPKGHG